MIAGSEALRLERIVKAYGPTVALDGASLSVRPGEVHALLGENGAGKSTTVKLLSGLIRPNSGTIRIFGEEAHLTRPTDAHRFGVQTAFQEISLVRDLTVTENMLLPNAPVGAMGLLRRRRGEQLVRDHLESLGLGHVNPKAEVGTLDLPQRQKIEIARAVFRQPRVLLLDEPTSALSGRDIDWLGGLIERLKAGGVTTIFISHRMAEVRRFCDRLTVLRNGKDAGSAEVADISDDEVIRMIIGRSLSATFPPKPPKSRRASGAVPVLGASGLVTGGKLRDAGFDLWPGEILGIAGLQGMGQQELFHACFGLEHLTAGTIKVDGRPVTLASPQDAIRSNIGISLVPEERKTEGLFLKRDGCFNVSLPVIDRFSRAGFVDRRAEEAAVARVLDLVEVHPRALYTRAGAFSGGNQQKIAIGKWLLTGSRVLLMFDPTRGVDIGTKHQLYVLMRDFAAAGGSILFYSTEITELVNLCDRVLVMYGGRIVEELEGDTIEEERIMRAALGGPHPVKTSAAAANVAEGNVA
jgi:ribose transport system ATP-binding protein